MSRSVVDRWESETVSRARLGGKGFFLTRMRSRGFPVPPFRTIEAAVLAKGPVDGADIDGILGDLSAAASAELGIADGSIAFAVRSSAPRSMPGMMDTILCLGLSPESLPDLTARLGSVEAAWSTLATGARGLCLHAAKLPAESVAAVDGADRAAYLRLVDLYERGHGPFPATPAEQVAVAVAGVADSWRNTRAEDYRRVRGIGDGAGRPSVVVQVMVFGAAAAPSGSGVVFSHSPVTGSRGMHGEYLAAMTGEGLVSGTTTPSDIDELLASAPEAHRELAAHVAELFRWLSVMVEVEFVVERGTVWLLQTRPATGSAHVFNTVAIDAWRDGLLTRAEALARLDVDALFQPTPSRAEGAPELLLAKGTGASPGVATGRVATSAEAVLACADGPAVLLRPATEPEDFLGMANAAAVVTLEGGSGSHAAVVAREIGRPAVVGARFLDPGLPERAEGALVTVCGTTGRVWDGAVPIVGGEPPCWPEDLIGSGETGLLDDAAELAVLAPGAVVLGDARADVDPGGAPVAFICPAPVSDDDWRVDLPSRRLDHVIVEPGRRRDYVRAVLAVRESSGM